MIRARRDHQPTRSFSALGRGGSHGVASGDPLADAVIIWSHVTPEAPCRVNVRSQVARDVLFGDIVESGRLSTDEDLDCNFVGQQLMMGQLPFFFNNDVWDGYPAARLRFLDILKANHTNNVVVLTGDIHSSWATNLTPDHIARVSRFLGFHGSASRARDAAHQVRRRIEAWLHRARRHARASAGRVVSLLRLPSSRR